MRLPNTAHTSRPWRIHEIARDFRLEDVWALPTPGGPDDFPRLVRQIAAGDPSRSCSGAARALWALRWKVGELLGWDRPDAGLGSRVPTLRDRLPAYLRDAPSGQAHAKSSGRSPGSWPGAGTSSTRCRGPQRAGDAAGGEVAEALHRGGSPTSGPGSQTAPEPDRPAPG